MNLLAPDYRFVVSQFFLPADDGELSGQLRSDQEPAPNQFGALLRELRVRVPSLDVQAAVADGTRRATTVTLLNLRAESFTLGAGAGLWTISGASAKTVPCRTPTDCGQHLAGDGEFTTSGATMSDYTAGDVLQGRYVGGPGHATLELSLFDDGRSWTAPLRFARHEVEQTSETALTAGLVFGALDEMAVDELERFLFAGFQARVMTDCESCNCTTALASQVLEAFDHDDDCSLEEAEWQADSLLSLLVPAGDIFDSQGDVKQDGVAESWILGVGFDAVPARFEFEPDGTASCNL